MPPSPHRHFGRKREMTPRERLCYRDGAILPPSFPWKEVPRRGGGSLPKRDEKEMGRGVSSYCHPERSRGIFFVCRFLFPVYIRLHETPSSPVVWKAVLPVHRSPHSFCLTANEKDFSLSLEMTMRGKRHSRFSLLPLEGGAPKGRRLAPAD